MSEENQKNDPNTPETAAAPPAPPPEPPSGVGKKKIKARVLAECAYGKPNDVVKVTQEEADACEYLDTTKEAVAYAEKYADATDT